MTHVLVARESSTPALGVDWRACCIWGRLTRRPRPSKLCSAAEFSPAPDPRSRWIPSPGTRLSCGDDSQLVSTLLGLVILKSAALIGSVLGTIYLWEVESGCPERKEEDTGCASAKLLRKLES